MQDDPESTAVEAGDIAGEMQVTMQNAQRLTREEIRRFVAASSSLSFAAASREEIYGFVEGVLRAQRYRPAVEERQRHSCGVISPRSADAACRRSRASSDATANAAPCSPASLGGTASPAATRIRISPCSPRSMLPFGTGAAPNPRPRVPVSTPKKIASDSSPIPLAIGRRPTQTPDLELASAPPASC